VEDGEEIASPDTCERLAAILYQMQQQLPQETMQEAFASLAPEAQNIVSGVMREFSRSRAHAVTP
jgi:hypothetical protein